MLCVAQQCSLQPYTNWPIRQGSNELDSSSSTERPSSVMLSAAKHLAAARDRPFAEFTLSEANGLRVTRCDCSNWHGLFFTIEPCLSVAGDDKKGIGRRWVISHRGCNLAKTE